MNLDNLNHVEYSCSGVPTDKSLSDVDWHPKMYVDKLGFARYAVTHAEDICVEETDRVISKLLKRLEK